MSYIFAFLLSAIGVGILIKGFMGQGGGVLLLVGFCLLFGGITMFNNINSDEEADAEIQALESSLEHNIVNKEAYELEERNEATGSNGIEEEGEDLDFSSIKANHQKILEENRELNAAKQRQAKYEAEERELTMEE